jgi:hypothetical protein
MLKQKLDNVGVLIKYDATSLNSQIVPYVLLQKKDWLHPVPERRNSWTLVGGTIKGNNQSPEALKGEIERVIKEELLGGNDLAVCELFTELKEYGSPKPFENGKKWTQLFQCRFSPRQTDDVFCGLVDIRLGQGAGLALFSRDEISCLQMPAFDRGIVDNYFASERNC